MRIYFLGIVYCWVNLSLNVLCSVCVIACDLVAGKRPEAGERGEERGRRI